MDSNVVTASDTIGTLTVYGPRSDQKVYAYIILSNALRINSRRHALCKDGFATNLSFSSTNHFKWVP